MSTATSTTTTPGRANLADDLDHVTCCRDDDTTLCGLDASNMDRTTNDPSCVVCDDIELNAPGRCPYFGLCF